MGNISSILSKQNKDKKLALQTTIKKQASLEGIGIHTGKEIRLVCKPAAADSGITFIRTDIPSRPIVKADITNLSSSSDILRRTSIGEGESAVHTIEHLLAALSGLEIDNVTVEIDGPELPGLDGSAQSMVEIIKEAGKVEQDVARNSFLITEPIWIEDEDSKIVILPDVNFRVSYTLDYPNTNIKTQYNSFLITPEVFAKEIAPCRTFCLEEEVEHLRGLGLGKGASLDNTLVVGKEGLVGGELRFEDEFLRHKVLDLVGDLYLLGAAIRGHVIAVKSGHSLNISLAQKIYEQIKQSAEKKEFSKENYIIGKGALSTEDIKQILPHRYPFLMIDRIIELGEVTAVGVKKLTSNDYFFAGHFPKAPVMPGVLIIEALAQVAGVFMLSRKGNQGKIAYFMSINNAKFRQMVKPGDELRLQIEVTKFKTKTGQVCGRAFIEDKLVAEADLVFVLGE